MRKHDKINYNGHIVMASVKQRFKLHGSLIMALQILWFSITVNSFFKNNTTIEGVIMYNLRTVDVEDLFRSSVLRVVVRQIMGKTS